MKKSISYPTSTSLERDLEKEYREIFPTVDKKLRLVLTLITGFSSREPRIVNNVLVDSFSIELYKMICQSISIKKRGRVTKKILVFLSCLLTNIIFIKQAKKQQYETLDQPQVRHRTLDDVFIPPEGRHIEYLSEDESE